MVLSVERENRLELQADARTGQELLNPTDNNEFLALVYADDELLRAEFAAIIGASWSQQSPRQWQRRPGPPPERLRWRLEDGARAVAAPPRHPGLGGWARQRSPPSHPTG